MISVILATYNTADYLEKCVNSIINQTYKDLEIIIVDDGSTDNTAEILNGFQQKDCRIKVIHQENKGHSEARNVGMDNAHGDYYFFIDSDDYLHRQAIEILWNNMQETGADISIGNTTREEELKTTLENDYYVYTTMDAFSILTDYHSPLQIHKLPFTATWNKIFKAHLFSNVRFPTGHIRDDNFTCHRLIYNAKKIVFTKAKTYFYTYREGSVSNKGLINKDFMLAYKDRVDFFKEKGLTKFLPDTCSYYLNACLKTFYNMQDYSIIQEAKEFIKDNQIYLQHQYLGLKYKKEIEKMTDIIIYVDHLYVDTGISNWIRNFCMAFYKEYSISILTSLYVKGSKEIFGQYVQCDMYDATKTYYCKIFLHNFFYDKVPENIIAHNRFVILHCDYGHMTKEIQFDKRYKYIALADVVAKGMKEKFDIDCITTRSFMNQHKPQKVYRLLSATRLHPEKGIGRMLQLCQLLKDKNICFQWLIFCDRSIASSIFRSDYPELIYGGSVPNDTIINYMADADYVVQLTDYNVEGFCYAVHESLKAGTPVIVTDIPIFKDLVKDGYNGYRVPLDMQNIDLDKILNEIPKDFQYDDHFEELKAEWKKILDNE